MKFLVFLEEKIFFLIFQITFILCISLFLTIFKIPKLYILAFATLFILITFLYLLIIFYKTKKKINRVKEKISSLEEKYLIAEVIEKPKELEKIGRASCRERVLRDV